MNKNVEKWNGKKSKSVLFGKCSCWIVCAKERRNPAIPTKEAVLEFMQK